MDTDDRALGVAARVPAQSAGHAAFVLTSFIFGELLNSGALPRQRARIIVSRAALWADRSDPAAAALIDALTHRIEAG